MNRVSWGIKVNTALIFKSYVRSIMEYGLMVYYPKNWKGREILNKLQTRGIRIALGYRNNTPINVMTAEAQVLRVEDRVGFLARNFWTKVIMHGGKNLEALMNRLDIVISRNRFRNPRNNVDIFMNSWRLKGERERKKERKL